LHTVGPIGEIPENLESCYRTCLDLVEKQGIRTVAFCGVSTGIFGFPLYPASRIAIEVTRKWLEEGDHKDKVDRIIFCTFLAKEKDCYEKLMPEYFPLPVSKEEEIKREEAETKNG
jgi:O-acetyl-ADP-ribose deacetylase (regulator of RNase III)